MTEWRDGRIGKKYFCMFYSGVELEGETLEWFHTIKKFLNSLHYRIDISFEYVFQVLSYFY